MEKSSGRTCFEGNIDFYGKSGFRLARGLGIKVCEAYADFTGKQASDNDIQMMVYSRLE